MVILLSCGYKKVGFTTMDVRYQVFISSTISNLENERRTLMEALLRLDCFPAGMEWFPAIDDEQFEFIKQVIDASDYYVLVLGGLYGTVAPDGKSYTEKEYDYAVSIGKKVIALVQRTPAQVETDDDLKIKFSLFHKKVLSKRLVNFWNNTEELATHMIASLTYVMGKYPAQGWIRCNSENCDTRLPFVGMNSAIDSLDLNTIETVHIMASGTLSYINVVQKLLSLNRNSIGVVNVYVCFRLGSNIKRIEQFQNSYNIWWNNIKIKYPNVQFHFICQEDFKSSFRGIVINKKIGIIGFYSRCGDVTYGTLDNCILVNERTNVGLYILGCFLKCFQEQLHYPTLKECTDQTIMLQGHLDYLK